jgi:hypothetical protein
MKPINNKGIALITALMLTLITLVIILGVLFMISSNTKSSAATKTYRNVTEAAYGGADLLVQDIIPRLFTNQSTGRTSQAEINAGTPDNPGPREVFGPTISFPSNACIKQKLNSAWPWPACSGDRINPKTNPDITFRLPGPVAGGPSFTVYSKIVDTNIGVPYPNSGSKLLGGGVTESSSGSSSNLNHYVYLLEIQGERTVNPSEKSRLSVLYEY